MPRGSFEPERLFCSSAAISSVLELNWAIQSVLLGIGLPDESFNVLEMDFHCLQPTGCGVVRMRRIDSHPCGRHLGRASADVNHKIAPLIIGVKGSQP